MFGKVGELGEVVWEELEEGGRSWRIWGERIGFEGRNERWESRT
jgi:hypothetical protein